jgi:hypothetical protein
LARQQHEGVFRWCVTRFGAGWIAHQLACSLFLAAVGVGEARAAAWPPPMGREDGRIDCSRRSGSGLWRGWAAALLSGQSGHIVGATGSEAARIALAAGDFDTVEQRVAVFDLLGMVAATVLARGHLSPDELHAPMVCAGGITVAILRCETGHPEKSRGGRSAI